MKCCFKLVYPGRMEGVASWCIRVGWKVLQGACTIHLLLRGRFIALFRRKSFSVSPPQLKPNLSGITAYPTMAQTNSNSTLLSVALLLLFKHKFVMVLKRKQPKQQVSLSFGQGLKILLKLGPRVGPHFIIVLVFLLF